MQAKIEIVRFITKQEEGSYFALPFDMPENVEKVDIYYSYPRHSRWQKTQPLAGQISEEINVIDLALAGPGGFVGAAGANRGHVWLAEKGSAAGFANGPLLPGGWQLIAGAYKVQPQGVQVEYTVQFTYKQLRCFVGDTHLHTLASDGGHTLGEVCQKAVQHGLDYIIIADHNNFAQNLAITGQEEITIIPGCELTHYKGHCNLIGVKKPLQKSNPALLNSQEEVQAAMQEAKENGALVSINHPFCCFCGWQWGIGKAAYGMAEVWNGGIMPQDNAAARKWWHESLVKGEKIVAIGGSDYHFAQPMRQLAQPCTGVWAMSCSAGDILAALQRGSSFISINPQGPGVHACVGSVILGGSVKGGGSHKVSAKFTNLEKGDVIHIITATRNEEISCEGKMPSCTLSTSVMQSEVFVRFEVYRMPWSMLLNGPVMLSNPIYFED